MKTIIVIETIGELFRFANSNRESGAKKYPLLPCKKKLIFENNMEHVRLEAEGFELAGEAANGMRVFKEIVEKAGFKVHVT